MLSVPPPLPPMLTHRHKAAKQSVYCLVKMGCCLGRKRVSACWKIEGPESLWEWEDCQFCCGWSCMMILQPLVDGEVDYICSLCVYMHHMYMIKTPHLIKLRLVNETAKIQTNEEAYFPLSPVIREKPVCTGIHICVLPQSCYSFLKNCFHLWVFWLEETAPQGDAAPLSRGDGAAHVTLSSTNHSEATVRSSSIHLRIRPISYDFFFCSLLYASLCLACCVVTIRH